MSKLENKENKAKKTKKTVAKTVKAVKKAKTKTIEPTVVDENVFSQRLHKHYDELKWLYCELYQDDKQPFAYFDELMKKIKEFYIARPNYLKELDIKREQQPDWYKGNKLLGMMMYVNSFSGTLKNFEKRLPYIQESNVNYLHLMPLLSSPKGKSDGGYNAYPCRPDRSQSVPAENVVRQRSSGRACGIDQVPRPYPAYYGKTQIFGQISDNQRRKEIPGMQAGRT